MSDKTIEIKVMENHLREHPNDWQTVVQLLKTKSEQIEYEQRQAMIPILRRLSEIRRRNKNAEQAQ